MAGDTFRSTEHSSRGRKTAAGPAPISHRLGNTAGRCWLLFRNTFRNTLQSPQNAKKSLFPQWRLPVSFDLAGAREHTASDTEELNHIFFFPLFPRCTELNLIRCYITSVRGCMANLIKKKQCVSPSLADSFTSWHLWEKPPLRHILQPL